MSILLQHLQAKIGILQIYSLEPEKGLYRRKRRQKKKKKEKNLELNARKEYRDQSADTKDGKKKKKEQESNDAKF